MKKCWFAVSVYFVLVIILISLFHDKMDPSDWIQLLLMTGLIVVTIAYAWQTKKQAEASAASVLSMREQTIRMREQTIMASRPVIIQKSVLKQEESNESIDQSRKVLLSDYHSHFVVMNVGNGPAIELEISLLDSTKSLKIAHRETFLKSGEELCLNKLSLSTYDEGNYYLVSEYKCLFPFDDTKTWQQTCLPFKLIKASETGEFYVKPGELTFREVVESERLSSCGFEKPQ